MGRLGRIRARRRVILNVVRRRGPLTSICDSCCQYVGHFGCHVLRPIGARPPTAVLPAEKHSFLLGLPLIPALPLLFLSNMSGGRSG
jgi:hypothetical protein